jgi:hypothetical protein
VESRAVRAAQAALKIGDVCKYGHVITVEIYTASGGAKSTRCLACRRAKSRAYRDANRLREARLNRVFMDMINASTEAV